MFRVHHVYKKLKMPYKDKKKGESRHKKNYYSLKNQGRCVSCRNKNDTAKTRCNQCSEKRREHYQKKDKLRHRAMRDCVFSIYGTTCKCCGEDERVMLDVDHIKEIWSSGTKRISFEKEYELMTKFPDHNKWRTLCCGCNTGRYRNGGICPHQETNLKIIFAILKFTQFKVS